MEENENLKKQNNLRDEVKDSQEELDTTPDYISAINDIKNNSVPKESYDKLREENKKLINALSTRQPESQETPKEDPIDLNKLREKTFKGECTNLEFIENSLKIREEVLKREGKDIFLPQGKNIHPTQEDINGVSRVVDCLNHCIEVAEGDSSIFTTELQKHLEDPIQARVANSKNNQKNLFN